MIAREVPTHSCMRTESGTPSRRNISKSTGTMMAPPPMPKSPARTPLTIPAAMTAAASDASSPIMPLPVSTLVAPGGPSRGAAAVLVDARLGARQQAADVGVMAREDQHGDRRRQQRESGAGQTPGEHRGQREGDQSCQG